MYSEQSTNMSQWGSQKSLCLPKKRMSPPNVPHTPIICISVFASRRRAASYQGPSLSLNFSFSVAEPSWKTQSCASGKRPLGLGWLKTNGLRFSFGGASDNLRGELVRDQVCGPRVRVAGRPLHALAFLEGGITGNPECNCAVSVRQADSPVTDTLPAVSTTAALHARSAWTHSDSTKNSPLSVIVLNDSSLSGRNT